MFFVLFVVNNPFEASDTLLSENHVVYHGRWNFAVANRKV